MAQPLTGSRPPVKIVYRTTQNCVAIVGSLLVFLTHAPDLPMLEDGLVAFEQIAASHPEGCGILVYRYPEAALPPAELQRTAAQAYRRHQATIRGVAVLLAGNGFRSGSSRLVARMFITMARVSFPWRVFSEPAHASDWLSAQVPNAPSYERLNAELAGLLRLHAEAKDS